MSIAVVRQKDRGFARLGSSSDATVRAIADHMRNQCNYESEEQAGDLWMRHRPRIDGKWPPPFARIVARLESTSSSWDAAALSDIDPRYDEVSPSFTLAECRKALNNGNRAETFRFLYWLDIAMMMCDRGCRQEFVERYAMPAYRERFPRGSILLLSSDATFEHHLSLLRMGNHQQVNGSAALRDVRRDKRFPKAAAALHSAEVVPLTVALATVLGNLLPLRMASVGHRFGFTSVYVFGERPSPVIAREPFPREFIETFCPNSFFHGDEPLALADSLASPIIAWTGRFRNAKDYDGHDVVLLVEHFLDRFNCYIANRLEVCNETIDDTIDFLSSFEKYLTFDRICRECIQIAKSTEPTAPRLLAFAVLDKYQEMCAFPSRNPSRNFHYFCSRPFLTDILLPAFATLPDPWRDHFQSTATFLYDELYSTVRSDRGVWANQLVEPTGGVRVYREWDTNTATFVDSTRIFSDDEFVGEYVRSARNTHHGYLSDGEKRRRFAVFGSITTAAIPDSFTQLPLLMALADVLNPRSMSGREWIDQSRLTTV